MESKVKSSSRINLPIYGRIAFFGVGFFLVTMLLTAFIIIPKINQSIESQHTRDIGTELTLEAALFQRFVESQRTILEDLAKFPSLTNAVMLSNAGNRAINDLFDNVVISGNKGRLVLQDIAGNVLIQTVNDLQGSYIDNNHWVEQILSGSTPYHFQLLEQKAERFSFQISVPVIYNSYIEGVLSAEISVSLEQVFVAQTLDNDIAFTLIQNDITISTGIEHIEIVRKNSLQLNTPNLLFTYITDDAPIQAGKRVLRNTILSVLLFSLAISFLLFALLGYRGLVSGDQKAKINPSFLRAYALPILIGVIGAAASIAAYLIILNIQQDIFEEKLNFDSKQRIQAIREKVKSKLETLDAIEAFYHASTSVSRQEFKTFTATFLANHPSIKRLEWVPKVEDPQRTTYERQARRDGLDGFTIKEMDLTGNFVTAQQRDTYFPIYFTEPLQGNEQAIGFDLASNKKPLAVLKKARISGEKMATAPITLIQENGIQAESLIFYPVYDNQLFNDPAEGKQLLGFVLMVMRVDEIINETSNKGSTLLSLHVQDISEPNMVEVIYGDKHKGDGLSRSEVIKVAGREWKITTYANANQTPLIWLPWLILTAGLVFSGLITSGLIHLIRRREVVEVLVKQRTAELRMLSSTVANSNDIFIITEASELDADNSGPKIIYVNEAFTRLTGYSAEEAVGNTPRILQGKDTDRLELDKIRMALQTGETYLGELINYTKDGTEYWIELNISPLKDETGKIIQFSAVERDVTERKRAEAERETLIEKLIDSNEELERFAFVCSHDLQEPLRMIRSFSEKLQVHIADDLKDDEKGKRYFHFVTDGAARAQALIADILAYSSIDNDTQNLENFSAEALLQLIQNNQLESDPELQGEITYDKLPELRGNKTQLYQLFQNLINNGMKYHKPGTTPHVHVSVKDTGEHWQFAIKDNGIGMEERHLNKIFEVFQRLHRKSQYAGTGIGLSICKKVVARHGGAIWVESEKDVGSTFYITLLKPTLME